MFLSFNTDDYRKAAASGDFESDVVLEGLPDGDGPKALAGNVAA